ncbi:hypothetical protein ACEK06_06280 [Pseudomonas brenneri]|uniref:hypothetical protein n=1 Tax=Pseudomonas brenneri TaxID=129817 RepID=UPI003570F092
MTRSRMTAAATFAHLLGFAKHADEGDDEKDEARRAEEDDDKDDPKGRKAKRAEDDDLEDDDDDKQARKAKGEGDDPDDEDDPKGRKAKRAESDDDDPDAEDDDEQDDPKSSKAAVAKERARCARIMAHGLKSGNAEQAGVFAFDTNMTAAAAINALNAAGSVSGRGGNLKDRMAAANVKNVGAGGDGGGESSNLSPIAQKIIAAAARAKPQ